MQRLLITYEIDTIKEIPDSGTQIIHQILKDIEFHMESPITLQGLAKQYHMNANYLGRCFKSNVGKTLTQYLLDVRMEKACQILKESRFAVCEVAQECGYRDYFYFTRTFKKVTGMTPTEYRRHSEYEEQNR